MGWDGMRWWDGMGWDGIGWELRLPFYSLKAWAFTHAPDGMGWDGMGVVRPHCSASNTQELLITCPAAAYRDDIQQDYYP